MNKPMRWLGQGLAYALFIAFIGYFSNSPPYRHLPADMATVTLSLRHAGKLLGECRTLGTEELAGLPETMRALQSCPRERSPLLLELEIDNALVFSQTLQPRGLHGDGMASMYRRLRVPAGDVELSIRMKDHPGQETFPYQATRSLHLAPAQVLVIDFDPRKSEFVFL